MKERKNGGRNTERKRCTDEEGGKPKGLAGKRGAEGLCNEGTSCKGRALVGNG